MENVLLKSAKEWIHSHFHIDQGNTSRLQNQEIAMMRIMLLLIIVLVISACQKTKESHTINVQNQDFTITIEKNKINVLQCRQNDSIVSSWPLPYPVYQLQTGDINHDGNDDIAVGIIKATRRDTITRKRLFLFQIRNKTIIPLWLGSSLSHPLEDFRIRISNDSTVVVRALEKEKSQRYLIAEYEWFGFGLSFREYLAREISFEEGVDVLNY